ncbi:MAG TPA: glycosyltransferase family 4 protein, partial [Polyangiaceae bacterium]|nr:glycosyltransferase family 4 protein [Polyangiaceae bacterium]
MNTLRNGFATKPRKQPLRVAMVAACPFPANHGTPGAIRELAIALAKQGHEVHVVTYPHGEDLPVEGLHIHRVSAPFLRPGEIKIGPSLDRLVFDALMVPKLLEVIREHGIDVIHAHNYEATIAGALAKFATHVPLVYNGINNMADELPSYGFLGSDTIARLFGKLLDHLVPRSGDALIVLSEELKTYLESLGMPEDKIIVVPPGVIVEDFSHGDGARARARHG